ncbi:MAG: ABC transporter ATP-binding protein [Chloroflexota bacterium]|nr:ABC transporter ATP-binding protein [Chloroflexota bacterium]MDE2840601.1 ABC transporter ATP-binding protein [Chloroflexota bacterium]MDE2931065.1 ABC transporter ATP-binding protein [Chloroflexota bacterium]
MADPGTDDVDTAVEVQGITKRYGAQAALDQVDLCLGCNERLAVLGPNGAGKTTLIAVLATLVRPSAGTLRVMGFDSADAPNEVRRRIGVVAHQTYLYEELSARENLLFYGRLYGMPDLEARVEMLLKLVDIYPRRHEQIANLSRGMQQRVALARALVHDPDVLLLDEPDTGLDQAHLDLLASLVQGRAIPARTVILTTHNLDRALELCGRVAVLAQGRLVYQAASAALDRAALRDAYHRLAGAAP